MRTETPILQEWYDYESVRALNVSCECGAEVPDDLLEALCTGERLKHRCQFGKTVKLAYMDAFADSMIKPIPKTAASKQ